uniref:Uncharacterized protein n=1 Tax=Anguilla anguilla TaxID=7936 RepID=A0A0E9PTM1_ANGAN
MPLACSRLHFKVQLFCYWLPESAICDKLRNMNLCVNCPYFLLSLLILFLKNNIMLI